MLEEVLVHLTLCGSSEVKTVVCMIDLCDEHQRTCLHLPQLHWSVCWNAAGTAWGLVLLWRGGCDDWTFNCIITECHEYVLLAVITLGNGSVCNRIILMSQCTVMLLLNYYQATIKCLGNISKPCRVPILLYDHHNLLQNSILKTMLVKEMSHCPLKGKCMLL